jgi:hypothetical protein
MTKRKKQTRQPAEPVVTRNQLRTLGAIFALDVVTLLLGVAFFVIAAGIQLIIRSSAAYWLPAHRLMDFLFSSPASAPFSPPAVHGRTVIRLYTLLAFAVIMIIFSVFLLMQGGWCAQNLFCAATIQSSP